MKKNTLFIIVLLSVVGISKIKAQTLYHCNETKAYWTVRTEDSTFIYLKLAGHVLGMQRTQFVSVDNIPLQYSVAGKIDFSVNGDNSDFAVLGRYAKTKGDNFSLNYKSHLNIQTDTLTLPGGRKVLFWYFDMPQTISHEVKAQLFVDIVVKNRIFSLFSKQFANQDLNTIKQFLLTVIGTITQVEKNELTTLCANN